MYGHQSSAIVDQSLDNLIQSFISNKLSDIKSMQHQKSTLMIYCDASLPKNKQQIGIGVCMVGQQNVSFESEILKVEEANIDSLYGELQAVVTALKKLFKMLSEETYRIKSLRRVIINNDCIGITQLLSKPRISKAIYGEVIDQINELMKQLSESYPRIIFKVKYIGQTRNFYYEMADKLSREAFTIQPPAQYAADNFCEEKDVLNIANDEILFEKFKTLNEVECRLIRKAMTINQLIDGVQTTIVEKGNLLHIPTLEKAILKFNTELSIINAETLTVRLKRNIIANQLGERRWDLLRSDAAKQGFIVPDDAMNGVR